MASTGAVVQQPRDAGTNGEGSLELGQQHDGEEEVRRSEPAKPVIVRVKRKRTLPPIETLWLEVNDRAPKRQAGLQGLTLAETQPESGIETKPKFLFSRVHTVSSAAIADEVLLESLEELTKERKKTRKEQREPNIRPLTPVPSTKTNHDALARDARFQQVWSSRRGVSKAKHDDAQAMELFRLYDVVRVDVEAEAAAKAARREKAKQEAALVDEGQWLCNYLPLLREYLPAVAAEVETAKVSGGASAQEIDEQVMEVVEDFVYDVYTLEEDTDEDHTAAPTVVVADEGFDWRELDRDSNYDSEDSNAEENPNNDYPDEEDYSQKASSDSDSEQEDPFSASKEEYDTVAYDLEEEEMYWRPRR